MPIATALAVFFLIWWVVLFAVLPWGVRSQHETGEIAPGTDPGAPMLPNLKRKLLWTTLVTIVIFTAFYVVTAERLVTMDRMASLLGFANHKYTQ